MSKYSVSVMSLSMEATQFLMVHRGYFVIHSIKPRVFVAEDSFDELCDPECPRGVLLWINLPIVLGMVRRSFGVVSLGRLVKYVAWTVSGKDTTSNVN